MKRFMLLASVFSGCDDSTVMRPEVDGGPPPILSRDAGAPDAADAATCYTIRAGRCADPRPGDFDADGYLEGVDCDDHDYAAYPGARELLCNHIDEDCDGLDYCPVDADGDGEPGETDCDDYDSRRSHAAVEIFCNGVDEDCSGFDPCDDDGDGYFTPGDCDDTDPSRHSFAEEISCDGTDQDCNGDDCCDQDFDGDGFRCADDCDDRDQFVYPGAPTPAGCVLEARDFDCDGDFEGMTCP
jgi:hypothetical protein